jgi:P pilus assembly chaperone PapD
VLALGGATLAVGVVLAGLVAGRSLLELDAMVDAAFRTRRTPDGRVISAYSVALENRGRAPVEVALAMEAAGSPLELAPAALELGPGERRQVRVVATARGLPSGVAAGELVAEARRAGETRAFERARRPLSVVVPEAR